jgi:hypothetical protein
MQRVLKFLSSLKLAVFTILLLAVLTSVGTFVEARFDAFAASKLVYRTPWMFFALGLLAVNLTAVMVTRWPWKRRHLSFLLAHVGILLLLLGSLITMQWGLDGSMRVGVGERNRFVQGPTTELVVWSSFDGDRFSKLVEREVDFFIDPPTKTPVAFPTDSGEIKVLDYKPYMKASRRVVASDSSKAGAAVQFQIQNPRVNVTEWLVQSKVGDLASHNFGPAQIYLGPLPEKGTGGNEAFVEPTSDGQFKYVIYVRGTQTKKGIAKEGEEIETGWMGLKLKILNYFKTAELKWEFQEVDRPVAGVTNAAIKILFNNKEYWLQQDDVLKLFTEKAVYIVTYAHRRIDIGFDIFLKEFEIGRYPGTTRAASYQSLVEVPELGETLISMNEPMKHMGLTVYQASFQEAPDGTPTASIFSINYDPGRWVKYLGSLIISLGVIVLFYDRRKSAKAQLAPKKWEES